MNSVCGKIGVFSWAYALDEAEYAEFLDGDEYPQEQPSFNFEIYPCIEYNFRKSDYQRNGVDTPKFTAKSAGEGQFPSASVYDKTPIPGCTVRG